MTPMIGRTHGVHAEPMTFGLKLALWYAETHRNVERVQRARETVRVGKISGAVGTFAHLDPAIEADVCRRLGLLPAPISSQVIQRDRHAELLSALAITAASLEKFALEIRGLQKTEIGEVEEPFGKGQKGSSAMPHKRNPIGCEQIVGMARLLRANAHAALENVALWHERDISHSSVERVILPDSFIALDHMLRRFTRIVSGMVVYPDRMRENLERSRGVIFSGQVLLELARRGVAREQAYEWVQRNAMRSFHEHTDFKRLLAADADVIGVLRDTDLDQAFDLNEQLDVTSVYDFSRRVFSIMRARVYVTLKPSVFDPQGRVVADALVSLGYQDVKDVRQGKFFEVELDASDAADVKARVTEMADTLLANPVIESYRVEVFMKFAVIVFPGSNSDRDAAYAAGPVIGQRAELVWHKDTSLGDADAVILPGGFAHGDYLRTGAIARFSPIMAAVSRFAARGGPGLGICNGFQILLEAGLLPGAMVRNDSVKFVSRHVDVRVEQTDTPFTVSCQPGQMLRLPVAHGEGNYFAEPVVLQDLEANRQVIFRYPGVTRIRMDRSTTSPASAMPHAMSSG